MRVFFFNFGNSSVSGGFSSYSRYITDLFNDKNFISLSDFGTTKKNSINLFFNTVGKEKLTLRNKLFHRLNQIIFVVTLIFLSIISRFASIKIWLQSSYLARSLLVRLIISFVARPDSLIIDVRDKEFLTHAQKFKNLKFISCGLEINRYLKEKVSTDVFDMKTPIPQQDFELISLIKNGKYLLYVHGIQYDKAPEKLFEILRVMKGTDYRLIICGRVRHSSKNLIDKLMNDNHVIFIGTIPKIALLSLAKGSSGIVITGENEGVPRIYEETKDYGLKLIIDKKPEHYLNQKNMLSYQDFGANFLSKSSHTKNHHQKIKSDENKFISFVLGV